jgi:hypothetical protein
MVMSLRHVNIGLLLLVVTIQPATAAELKSVATIVQTTGSSIAVSSEAEKRTVVLRQSLFVGDSIETGTNAWVTFNFYDLTRVILRPNTKFLIREFPETTPSGKIILEISEGGARITTGTIAAEDSDRFNLVTPYGELTGGRSEWVVRICAEDECEQLEQTFSRCSGYQSVPKRNRQFVAVYKGLLDLDYCPIQQGLNPGETSIFDPEGNSCQVLEQVPCFILLDEKLGRDKLRKFLPQLEPVAEDDKSDSTRPTRRPNSRAVQPRPRVDRTRRQPRRRR